MNSVLLPKAGNVAYPIIWLHSPPQWLA